jgi:hypothetical protein
MSGSHQIVCIGIQGFIDDKRRVLDQRSTAPSNCHRCASAWKRLAGGRPQPSFEGGHWSACLHVDARGVSGAWAVRGGEIVRSVWNFVFNLPIADRSVPNEFEIGAHLDTLVKQVQLKRGVGFHCRAGIGRSSMMAALVLGRLGWTSDTAFRAISDSRGCRVPDTLEQEQWVQSFVHKRFE